MINEIITVVMMDVNREYRPMILQIGATWRVTSLLWLLLSKIDPILIAGLLRLNHLGNL